MDPARLRLASAIAVSLALHVSLILGVAVREPARPLPALPHPEPHLQVTLLAVDAQTAATPPVSTRPQDRARAGPVPGRAMQWAGPAASPAPPPDSALPSVAMPLLADPTWYAATEVDLFPRALAPVQPAYPQRAARDGIRGEVTLLVSIDEHGAVHGASVARAAPEGYFEEAALAAFASAYFAPAQKDGRSVRSRVLVRVAFDPSAGNED